LVSIPLFHQYSQKIKRKIMGWVVRKTIASSRIGARWFAIYCLVGSARTVKNTIAQGLQRGLAAFLYGYW
jgi:hypothetical protein